MKTEILKILSDLDIDCPKEAEVDDYDALYTYLLNNGLMDVEIPYYGSAMQFLFENDPSLKDSLHLANDMGFDSENLTSEILASILATDMLKNELKEKKEEIEALFSQ